MSRFMTIALVTILIVLALLGVGYLLAGHPNWKERGTDYTPAQIDGCASGANRIMILEQVSYEWGKPKWVTNEPQRQPVTAPVNPFTLLETNGTGTIKWASNPSVGVVCHVRAVGDKETMQRSYRASDGRARTRWGNKVMRFEFLVWDPTAPAGPGMKAFG